MPTVKNLMDDFCASFTLDGCNLVVVFEDIEYEEVPYGVHEERFDGDMLPLHDMIRDICLNPEFWRKTTTADRLDKLRFYDLGLVRCIKKKDAPFIMCFESSERAEWFLANQSIIEVDNCGVRN
jgi:hypothetical protein